MSKLSIRLQRHRKLNFGCGADKRPGYLNVDIDPDCQPDLLIINNDYSVIPKNHYREILANDVLEHIEREKTFVVLLEWATYLKLGGVLSMQTSSVVDIVKNLQQKDTFEHHQLWLHMLFGTQAKEGDYHLNSFTKSTLKTLLGAAGFDITHLSLRDRWLFQVEAQKISDWTQELNRLSKVTKDNQDFLDIAYRELLGRQIDKEGLEHNLNALNNGTPRIAILKQLYVSKERLNNFRVS